MNGFTERDRHETYIHRAAANKLYGVPACNPAFQVGDKPRKYGDPRTTTDPSRINCPACAQD